MTRQEFAKFMDTLFSECAGLRVQGQKEYAHQDSSAFANFERVAERTKDTREKVLMVHLEKHLDGIHSWVGGHRSQREPVRGRITDAIVYLTLLAAMVEEAEQRERRRKMVGFVACVAGALVMFVLAVIGWDVTHDKTVER